MKTNDIMTKFPLQVTFRNVEPLAAMELRIRSDLQGVGGRAAHKP